ncbi:gamma-glutamyltransferase [candidate division KSB1 bacterium]|nr:gamma-glutamyltransferase [candidate division KSB1 bacterium]NIR71431.1 gamma-glutamyltransferase [candidate division KSB1 bacterium]NIS23352.1 gamma-glutamyltransferase [candidate division KSB1 bacterium]NIT70243.1 gamma-glutamyltransferase [candidate division KSB1 bacterium]NIU23966.1 gamma-glutamyltransferase [candidate division KSB1 bacterium]
MPKLHKVSAFLIFVCIFIVASSEAFAKKWPVYAKHGMVVSTERVASEVGVEILKEGGNAIDAAVATAFTLAVVHPAAGNIGGGGFMVIRLADGTTTTIDYREKAPLAAHERMYLNENGELIEDLNHEGYLAIGVPGTVAGLVFALEKYGTMPLAKIMKPAIKLAENGFPVSYALSQDLTELADTFKKYPASASVFLKSDGTPYQFGEVFKQRDLAATLKRIADHGRDDFYAGKTAELLVRDMKANGGLIGKKDLENYSVKERQPIECTYRGYTIASMAPPSSGGITLAIMLNILEGYDLAKLGHNSAAYIHLVTEAMRRAYAERAKYLGDPDFNPDMPVEELISKAHAQDLRETIDLTRASKSDPGSFEWAHEATETTHFSVIDKQRNAVSNTYTIEQWFGSKIVAHGAGFLYNNEMGDFNPWPGHTDSTGLIGTEPNLIEPGKRMLSSMTPTIVLKDGQAYMLVGSPGGKRIINIVLQTILNVVDFGMNIYEAVDAPRFHHQWLPDKLYIERRGTSNDSAELLQQMGHKFRWTRTQGRVMAIMIDPETGLRIGAADPRSPMRAAVGY